jgi:hypothetical protein
VGFLGFAFLAEVKVRADTALIANACHGNYWAAIAWHLLMNLCCLISCLFAEVIDHQSLECLGRVWLDLILDYLN